MMSPVSGRLVCDVRQTLRFAPDINRLARFLVGHDTADFDPVTVARVGRELQQTFYGAARNGIRIFRRRILDEDIPGINE
jgi:hypothetical protein